MPVLTVKILIKMWMQGSSKYFARNSSVLYKFYIGGIIIQGRNRF